MMNVTLWRVAMRSLAAYSAATVHDVEHRAQQHERDDRDRDAEHGEHGAQLVAEHVARGDAAMLMASSASLPLSRRRMMARALGGRRVVGDHDDGLVELAC